MFVLVVLLTSLSPITTEMFAPAMPYAAEELQVWDVEGSVAIFMIVSAFFHILYGYLVHYTRAMPVAVFGLLVYASASLLLWGQPLCDACGTYVFHALRAFQGLGGAACSVAGFALLRNHLNVRIYVPRVNSARGMMLVGIPMVSEVIVAHWTWRECFLFLSFIGFLALAMTMWEHARPSTANPYRTVLFQPVAYTVWIVSDAFSFASMFLWVSYASFLNHTPGFGYWYGLTFLGGACGSLVAARFPSLCAFVVSQLCMLGLVFLCTLLPDTTGVFVSMTAFNFFRAVAAVHAQTAALTCGPSSGKASGFMYGVRMLVTSSAVALGLREDPWVLMVGYASVSLTLMGAYAICTAVRFRPRANVDGA